jgi:hypothetical protein
MSGIHCFRPKRDYIFPTDALRWRYWYSSYIDQHRHHAAASVISRETRTSGKVRLHFYPGIWLISPAQLKVGVVGKECTESIISRIKQEIQDSEDAQEEIRFAYMDTKPKEIMVTVKGPRGDVELYGRLPDDYPLVARSVEGRFVYPLTDHHRLTASHCRHSNF